MYETSKTINKRSITNQITIYRLLFTRKRMLSGTTKQGHLKEENGKKKVSPYALGFGRPWKNLWQNRLSYRVKWRY